MKHQLGVTEAEILAQFPPAQKDLSDGGEFAQNLAATVRNSFAWLLLAGMRKTGSCDCSDETSHERCAVSKPGFQLDTALNVAIKTSQSTDIAEERKIEQVGDQSWWPKYIAARIMGGGYNLAGKKEKKVGVYRMAGTKSQLVPQCEG